ncbi:uncharacterized protein LOC113231622 isoform X2 [Hyposmocoma kahamanoa]|uniref:uncharacterized protein LOC113231622 isoform X2 n=1 Tax=Hyposmocoma kahamanoa TaxID=1477025 RepID=UPI000E6DA2BE|nr:uncharacterized protein LOC113231622 isoform X2 [Hyposmocoma kahamanoa]
MLKVKLVVLFVLILVPILTDASYCEICVNHTLCQYPISGPSKTCIEYDVAALLTRGDISDIVHRINDRRNFIALGLSNRLPQAANMRKINWSKELATIAQRWVDQCDPSINPDKWDSCRDLADVAVGQNVATIIGPAPGLSVKSFIDMWLMQKLDYTGSVSYYNQSRDAKSGYLTQLIWAATDSVGCGRAKFYIEDKNIVVERLICNFAPRGNLQGKPVYAVGFAATQCPESLFPDYTMKGLCTVRKQTTGNFKHRSSTATSFLRVINLSNESVKQEIDPLKNNMKQVKLHGPSDQRNQKIRHVLMNNVNNSHADKPLFPPRRIPWNIQTSSPGNTPVEQYETEKGHSKVYHGYDKDNFIPRITQSSNQEFRRYDFTTEAYVATYATSDLRRHGIPDPLNSCSRRPNCNGCVDNSCGNSCRTPGCNNGCISNRCTRGQRKECCHENQPCAHGGAQMMCRHDSYPYTPLPCPPICPPACPPAPYPCCETTYCNSHTTCCPKIGRRDQSEGNIGETRKSGELHYYDLLPNLAVRSGDAEIERSLLPKKKLNVLWPSITQNVLSTLKAHKKKEYHESNDEVKTQFEHPKYISDGADFLYGSFDYSDRVRREPEDHVTFKPFWQLDEYSNLKPSQLKSLHYTTLKKNRKKWPVSVTTQTESITIKLENSEIEVDDDEENEVTEKYLSFDELMHLRKINAGGYDARRDKKKPDKKKSQKKKPDKQKLKDKNAKTTKKTKTTKKAKPTKKAKTTKKDKTTKKAKTTKIAKTTKKAKVTTAKVKTTTPQTDKLKVDEDKDKKKETENKNDKKETTKATKLQPTAASLPLNYTTNTPFQRKKHCTRQLTCTWTVATVTASDGSVVIGGGGAVHGSRTPPGYVEGCTRTSTCTRDFQNRNKYMTPENEETNRGDGGGNDDGDDSNDEGDYCDRRALDVKLRNFEGEPEHNHGSPETHTVPATTPPYHNPGTTPMCKTDKLGSGPTDHCDCNEENIRPKRHLSSDQININSHGCHANCDIRNTNQQDQLLSYGELYYLVLSKIMKTWGEIENSKHSENCECSGSTTLSVCYLGLALIIIFNAMQ